MANKSGFFVDDKVVMAALDALSGKEMKSATKSALRKSANILKRETDKLFAQNTNLTKRNIMVTTRKGKVIRKAPGKAMVKIYQDKATKMQSAKVHILQDYMMKWFEMGTKERRTKGRKVIGEYRKREGGRWYRWRMGKGHRTGRINAGRYFERAQKNTERRVFDSIDSNLSQAIIRIWNKKNM